MSGHSYLQGLYLSQGDTVQFTFNGTDIYVYGDNKKNRGVYAGVSPRRVTRIS